MSDTPRTDKAIFRYGCKGCGPIKEEAVEPDFARKLERECDQLEKQCVRNVEEIGQLRAELREAKSINLELAPNAWTLEHFKSISDIKMPDAAMVSGDQLLELLTDSKRLAFLLERSDAEFYSKGCHYCITREEIDKAMEARKS